MAQTPSAADYQKGGPPRGGPSQSMTWVGSDQPDSACNTMTRDGLGQTGPACNTQRPPLTFEQWCAKGFEADVAHALVDGQAVPEDLVADPPRTFRAVMSSLGQWVGSATGAVTRLLARGSYDSIVLAALRPSAVMAQTPSAADYQKGGPPSGGPSRRRR